MGFKGQSQSFTNGDLEGPPPSFSSLLPPSWLAIPYDDAACEATNSAAATPDLTDDSGPSAGSGVFGDPYSGNTFMSGLHAAASSTIWHEGIMQEVSGFNPGCTYRIGFYQSVVKGTTKLDTSGSWIVYFDNVLIGVSTPSVSFLAYDNPNLSWDSRSLNFVPDSSVHTIKFLPFDDDTDQTSLGFESGSLRMGIDSIHLELISVEETPTLDLGSDTLLCPGALINLVAGISGYSYEWHDGSVDTSYIVNSSGEVSVTMSPVCGFSVSDTIQITLSNLNVDLGADPISCEDSVELNAGSSAYEYDWGSGYTIDDSTIWVSASGEYIVLGKDTNGCEVADSIIVTLLDCTGIDEREEAFLLYPNPAVNILNVQPQTTESYQIFLYDMTGRLLIEQREIRDVFQLDLSDLSSGSYIVEIKVATAVSRYQIDKY